MWLVDCTTHLDTAMQEQSKLVISAARLCSDLEQTLRKIRQSARLTLCLCETFSSGKSFDCCNAAVAGKGQGSVHNDEIPPGK